MRFRTGLVAAALIAAAGCSKPAPEIRVADGWASETGAGQQVAAGYLTIVNSGGPDRLVAVSSPRANEVGIHATSLDGGVMRMRPVEALEIGQGATVVLAPAATHLMLTGVREPLKAGQSVPVTLTFELSGNIAATLAVRPAMAGPAHAGH